MKSAKEAVRDFVETANQLRLHPSIELGFALVDLMLEKPIKTSYALLVPAQLYANEVNARLPEE